MITVYEGLRSNWGLDEDRWVVTEVEAFPVSADNYRVEGPSLRFAEVAYERYLMPSTDLHGITSLAAHCRIVCADGYEGPGLETAGEEDERNFEGLVIVKELKRTGVRGRLREVEYACRAKGQMASSSMVGVIEIAPSVRTA